MRLQLAKWIKGVNGQKGTVVYDFKYKTAFLVDRSVWQELNSSLPSFAPELCRRLQQKSTDENSYADARKYVEFLVKREILVPEVQKDSFVKEEWTTDDDISFQSPLYVSIEATSRCNFRCKHCYVGSDKEVPTDLPIEVIQRLSGELQELRVRRVQITGGEPFIRGDIGPIISHLSSIFELDVNTNGSILKSDTATILQKARSVQVSIYGFSESSFRKFTRASEDISLATIVRNSLVLRDKGINLMLAFIAVPSNTEEIPLFVEYCSKQSLNYRIGFPMPIGDCLKCWDELKLDLSAKQELMKFQPVKDQHRVLKKYSCDPTKLAVLSDGQITPCSMLRGGYSLGNANKESIIDVWHNEFPKFRESICLDQHPVCGQCELKYVCGGACPATPIKMSIDSLPQNCPIYGAEDVLRYFQLI